MRSGKTAEIAAQARFALQQNIPWSWKTPKGLHTDGSVLFHWALPIAYLSGAGEIVGFRATGYSRTTSGIISGIVVPISNVILDDAYQFEVMLNRNAKRWPQLEIPTPKKAKQRWVDIGLAVF